MIIFLYGADTYRSAKQLLLLKDKFISERSQSDLNILTLPAFKLKIEELRRAILSGGLFSEKRMVVVEKLLNKESVTFGDKLIPEIINIIEKIKEDKENILIFKDEEIDEKDLSDVQNKLFIILKKEKFYPEFKRLSKGKVKIWVEKIIKENNLIIEEKALDYLIETSGNNLWIIGNELDKLIAHPQQDQILLDDIKDLVKPTPEQNIWNLIDAFGSKNKIIASQLLLEQTEAGITTDYLISMLNYQYKIIIRVKAYLMGKSGQNISPQQIAKDLSLHPYVCQKALSQQENYKMEELKKIYQELLEIDILKKTRQIDAEVLLNLLIIKK